MPIVGKITAATSMFTDPGMVKNGGELTKKAQKLIQKHPNADAAVFSANERNYRETVRKWSDSFRSRKTAAHTRNLRNKVAKSGDHVVKTSFLTSMKYKLKRLGASIAQKTKSAFGFVKTQSKKAIGFVKTQSKKAFNSMKKHKVVTAIVAATVALAATLGIVLNKQQKAEEL